MKDVQRGKFWYDVWYEQAPLKTKFSNFFMNA